jgi:hypothetical protein
MKNKSIIILLVIFLKASISTAQYVPMLTDAQFDAIEIDQSKSVGKIEGYHGTTQTGAATYTIPIQVPEGINGMTPQLAITYNSQAGNGLLGYGWSLSGLSNIIVDGDNLYYDGIVGYSDQYSHPFLLDGKRLISISGSYGENNSTYGLENEDFSRITSYGGTTSKGGPFWFEVNDKSGITREYGKTEDSKILMDNDWQTPYLYCINREIDNFGNYIEYKYQNISEQLILEEINYLGNINNLSASYKIIFLYSYDRVDKNTFYDFGIKINQNVILDEIILQKDGNEIKRYNFDYANMNGRYSLLRNISLQSVNQSVNSTFFNYNCELINDKPKEISTSDVVVGVVNYLANIYNSYSGDLNGDGIDEIILFDQTVPTPEPAYTKKYSVYNINENGEYIHRYTKDFGSSTKNFGIDFADVNGDGKEEMILTNRYVWLDGITGITYIENNSIDVISFNNDLSSTTTYRLPIPVSNLKRFAYKKYESYVRDEIIIGDFDGDKINDIITFGGDYNSTVFLHLVGKNIYNIPVNIPQSFLEKMHYNKPIVLDFDGNGKSEILLDDLRASTYTIDKIGNNYYMNIISSIGSDLRYCSVGDFNGDGKSDLFGINYFNIFKIYYSNGISYVGTDYIDKSGTQQDILEHHTMFKNKFLHYFINDFDGDGLDDIMQYGIDLTLAMDFDDEGGPDGTLEMTRGGYKIFVSNGVEFKLTIGHIYSGTEL